MADKIRVIRTDSYTTVQNSMILDQRLSLKTRGLMAIILSRPDDWEFSVAGLAAFCGCGKDAIRSALKELEEADYLERQQTHSEGGQFAGNEYVIRETSPTAGTGSPLSGFPTTGKPSTGNPSSGNPTQRNKDLKKEPPKVPHKGNRKKTKAEPTWKPERFEKFWAYYRQHVRGEDRQSAVREWDKLRPDDETIDAMGRALTWQIKTEDWVKGVGIPYACRYLKNRRWEDEPPRQSGERSEARAVVVESRFEKL